MLLRAGMACRKDSHWNRPPSKKGMLPVRTPLPLQKAGMASQRGIRSHPCRMKTVILPLVPVPAVVLAVPAKTDWPRRLIELPMRRGQILE